MSEKPEVRLAVERWDYECGDGCCYDWGERLYVDGREVINTHEIDVDAVEAALEALGYRVVIEEEAF